MDESKVRSVKDVVEVVEVVPYLNGGELTFVDDVGRGQGADVEAGCQATDRQLQVNGYELTSYGWPACGGRIAALGRTCRQTLRPDSPVLDRMPSQAPRKAA